MIEKSNAKSLEENESKTRVASWSTTVVRFASRGGLGGLEPGPVKVRASCVALVRSTLKRDKTGQCHMSHMSHIRDGMGNKHVCMREGVQSNGERMGG